MTADPTPDSVIDTCVFGADVCGAQGVLPGKTQCAFDPVCSRATAEIGRLRADNEKLRAKLNTARSSDIPYLLGMLTAYGVETPKFIAVNQDRWRKSLSAASGEDR